MSDWGGKREGAGRKKEVDRRPVKVTVKMTKFTHSVILREGSGNLSNGIEKIVVDAAVNKGYSHLVKPKQ